MGHSRWLYAVNNDEQISANRTRRAEVREAREALREDTLHILRMLKNNLGLSYEDASALLGVDGAMLLRLMHSSSPVRVDDL